MPEEIKDETKPLDPSSDVDAFLSTLRLPEKYSNIRLIGQGGMGIVVQAWDSVLLREVAVKLLLGERANDDKMKARFLRESKILASLDHENIVRILSSGITTDAIPYYVMELLKGHSLAQELKETVKLKPAGCTKIVSILPIIPIIICAPFQNFFKRSR